MKTYYQITADLYREHVIPVITAKQGDAGRGVDITLTDSGAVAVPGAGEMLRLYCKKQDGNVSYLPGTLNGDTVRVEFTTALLAVPGTVECELQIGAGEGLVSTPVFRMNVLPSNIDNDALESTDEFTALEAAAGTVSQYSERLGAVEQTVSTLGTAATRGVQNNLTTTGAGSVLDARQGKVLNDKITAANTSISDLQQDVEAINDDVGDVYDTAVRTMVDSAYYDEITYGKGRFNNDTDYYWVTVPRLDKTGNVIPLYIGYSPRAEHLSPMEYARKNGTSLSVNGGIVIDPVNGGSDRRKYGNIISEGTVLWEEDITEEIISKGIGYVTFSQDRRTVKSWPITTTCATLRADATVYNCITYYCAILVNNAYADTSSLITNEGTDMNLRDVNLSLGVKSDGTLIFMGCEGRSERDVGMSPRQLAEKLKDMGCVNAWLIDGGGSSSVTVRGSKLNRTYDDGGKLDRFIYYTYNFSKRRRWIDGRDNVPQAIFSKIGEEKHLLMQQLMPEIRHNSDRYVYKDGLNLDGIRRPVMKYGMHTTGHPQGTSAFGFVTTIPHYIIGDTSVLHSDSGGSTDNDMVQYWTEWGNPDELYCRTYGYSKWSKWRKFKALLSTGDSAYVNGVFTGMISGTTVYFTVHVPPAEGSFVNSSLTFADESHGVTIYREGYTLVNNIHPVVGFVRVYDSGSAYIRLDFDSSFRNIEGYLNNAGCVVYLNGATVTLG